ncbi:MlaD family protein [Roseomonas sp. BN140053]|uniref:MlaD family protein n=1 Tax=Roseomonas sp. BN140053 TaxID=3391898 RepID=UPI0039EA9646
MSGSGRSGRRLYLRVGLLILAGIALAAGFVLFFTANRLNNDAVVFETYTRESVQGLEVGAPVRYRGVALGRVTEITLANSAYRRPEGTPFEGAFQLVVVRFAIDAARLGTATPDPQRAVDAGLRARLTSQGLTGVVYIELDFVDTERFPAETPPWQPQHVVIPSIPSTVAQVQDAAETLLARVQNIPVEAIVADLAAILSDLRAQTHDGDLRQAIGDSAALVRSLRDSAQAADLPGLVRDLRGAVAELRGVAGGPELRATLRAARDAAEQLRVTAQRLPNTVGAIDQTARATRGAVNDVNADLAPILRDLRATAANLRDTTDLIRRAPSQAILGAPPPAPPYATERRR